MTVGAGTGTEVGAGIGTDVGAGTGITVGIAVGAGTGAEDGLRVWITEVTPSTPVTEDTEASTSATKEESTRSASIWVWNETADPTVATEATTSKVVVQVPANKARRRRVV